MLKRQVTVDFGNSACKFALWEREFAAGSARRVVIAALPSAMGLARAAHDLVRAWGPLDVIAISCVASSRMRDDLTQALSGLAAVTTPSHGLILDLELPITLGEDRAFAARAAFEHVRGAALVVDAGTALTVDAIGVRNEAPVFLGGAIAPGPDLLARALANHTAALPLVVPRPDPEALGRTTRAALAAGIAIGFRGAARELSREVARAAGLVDAPIVVTGGARAFLLEPQSCFDVDAIVVEDLVHRGLLACLADAA